MFSLAMKWGWRGDNPARGIEKNAEETRERYLTPDELMRLSTALHKLPNQVAAHAIRLLLLTGARRGEVLAAKWEQFDLEQRLWVKPSSHTKQKKSHRVPLSGAAVQLLQDIRSSSKSSFVFPGLDGEHMRDLKKAWKRACEAADIRDCRLHDLRHTYASLLASSGSSLPIIGAMLGHTQPQTTARYAHLLDDPLRVAAERVSAIVSPRPGHAGAEVIPLGAATTDKTTSKI